ncbi:unnamed protein product [Alopecurus aequalis]
MGAGGGQAIFTAECSHTFHFHCISSSVAHGHLLCPLCNAHWRELPSVRPVASMPQTQPPPVDVVQPRRTPTQPVDQTVFDDDEQVEPAAGTPPADAAYNGAMVVKTHTDYTAIVRDSSHDNFAVLVHLKAPGTEAAGDAPASRAPLDLVTVLDVSRSMRGSKLALLKEAMRFVVDILGPDDRLCVVSFSSTARRVTRLARMSDAGKALCVRAVDSLAPRAGTNIADGLRTAAKVLDQRRARSAIAEATGGTFSFIENEAVIQDAFAQCLGGLLSVVVQDARVAVTCVHPGVRVGSVKSGLYESRVDEDGRAASIVAGELYAEEERRFLLFLVVPRAGETDGDLTTLIKVTCTYRDVAAGADVNVMADDTVVARPEHAAETARSVEVERELVRVEATEDIAAARAAAERGAYQEAVKILENRRRAVAQSGAARNGDAMIAALKIELQDMRRRVSSRQSFASSGRASMLAGMRAHMQQRGSSSVLQLPSVIGYHAGAVTTSAAPHQVSTLPYATPAMLAMLLRSRKAREAAAESGQQRHVAGEEAEGSEPKVQSS